MATAYPAAHEEEALQASSTQCAENSREPNSYNSYPEPHKLPEKPPVPQPTCE